MARQLGVSSSTGCLENAARRRRTVVAGSPGLSGCQTRVRNLMAECRAPSSSLVLSSLRRHAPPSIFRVPTVACSYCFVFLCFSSYSFLAQCSCHLRHCLFPALVMARTLSLHACHLSQEAMLIILSGKALALAQV